MKKVIKRPSRAKKVVRKVVTSRPPTLRAVLNYIDTNLCRGDIGEKLADVLGALRGPDEVSNTLKGCTTSVIRAKAFPKAAKASGGAINRWCFNSVPTTVAEPTQGSFHWQSHIRKAAKALNLKVV